MSRFKETVRKPGILDLALAHLAVVTGFQIGITLSTEHCWDSEHSLKVERQVSERPCPQTQSRFLFKLDKKTSKFYLQVFYLCINVWALNFQRVSHSVS